MNAHHIRAVIEQLSADERAFFEREPAKAWLAQMGDRLAAMSVPEAAELVRAQIPALSEPAKPPRQTRIARSESNEPGGAQ